MATLYIAEIDIMGIDAQGETVPGATRPTLVPEYSIPIPLGITPSLSPVFSAQTRFLELHCDEECWFQIAVNPAPVTSAGHLGAGERIYFPLRPNTSGLRVGVIG